jgi:hypothetical protein
LVVSAPHCELEEAWQQHPAALDFVRLYGSLGNGPGEEFRMVRQRSVDIVPRGAATQNERMQPAE